MKQWLVLLAACGSATTPTPPGGDDDAAVTPPAPDAPAAIAPLEVQALGVQGFTLRYGGDLVMTAPLFTRQSAIEVGLNLPLSADTTAIDDGLGGIALADLRAIVTGHAHYDHFMDVPHVLELAPAASIYTNVTGRNVLAALAPDRPAGCMNSPAPVIDRARVIALDDFADYTFCPDQKPPGASGQGQWVAIPNSHVRVMAFCSMHPDQLGPIHFAPGSIDTEQCELPEAASGWLEGQTLALLVDFLDEGGAPIYRVFYQDAPTNAPIGFVPEAVLAEHRVDLALLCVGSNDAVQNEPTDLLANIQPRFAFSGHWEDFFQPRSDPPQPIPLLDVNTYMQRANAALAGGPDRPLVVDGQPSQSRHVLVQPNQRMSVPAAP